VLSAIDLAIVLAFIGYCLYAGSRSREAASRGVEEYFLAGRTLPGWKAGISMAATQFSADTPLLVVGLVATAGVFGLWRLWIYALAFLFMGLVLGPAWRRASVLTDAELSEVRYGSSLALALRVAKAIYFGTIFNCAVIAMVLFATVRITAPLTGWDSVTSLGVVLAVTLVYSTVGGLRAVVDTDVVQFAIAMLATAIYAVVLVGAVGGLAALPGALARLHGSEWAAGTLALDPWLAREAGSIVLAVLAVQWIAQMNADGSGYLAQRSMACRSDREVRVAALVFVGVQILARSLLWLPIAIALLVLYPQVDSLAAREATYVAGIAEHLPAGIRGMMAVGMLAALASTLDTHLNWGASYWTRDIYERLVCRTCWRREPGARELVWIARASNVVILAIALAGLGAIESIQSAWHSTLLLGAGMGVPLVLRWLWWRVTAVTEIVAIACSTVLAPVLVATVADEGVRLLVIAGASLVTSVATTLLGPRDPDATTVGFYARVRPPGAWGPCARACGESERAPMRRLGRGVIAVAWCTVATFGALVGVGTWLVGAPTPIARPLWIGALLVLSVVGVIGGRRAIACLDESA
jgi:solute:Na+ symporter, SSS family